MKYLFILISLILLHGCYKVGHQDFVDRKNSSIGNKLVHYKPYKYPNSGKLIRGDFLLGGDGFTHISKDKDGNLVFHYFVAEVLPTFHGDEKWIGKCLIFRIINPDTKRVIKWGFDKGGNPLSCRSWP